MDYFLILFTVVTATLIGHKNDNVPGLAQLSPNSGAIIILVITAYKPNTRAIKISKIIILRLKKKINMVGPKK